MYDSEDTHLCNKCNETLVSLEEYIRHRKSNCASSSKSDNNIYNEHAYGAYDQEKDKKDSPIHNFDYDLGADLFFSSLELQSSTKKVLTKNKKYQVTKLVHSGSDIAGVKKVDDNFKYFISDEESEESYVEYDDCIPPRSHTGGKWKPENRPSSTTFATADWEHAWDEDYDENPPPEHTKGKWVPGSKITKMEYDNTLYWCSVCNRKLSSKVVFERHLKSKLHIRQTQEENELETVPPQRLSLPKLGKREINHPKAFVCEAMKENKKRYRRKYYTRCNVCVTRLPLHLMGKHLISHFHYTRMQKNPKFAYNKILEHMDKIVVQAPFQCNPCKYYTNTEKNFLDHWYSIDHLKNVKAAEGEFYCSFCKFSSNLLNDMTAHLLGPQHQDLVQIINRSVPIIIHKLKRLKCGHCSSTFRFNIEKLKHKCLKSEKMNKISKNKCVLCEKLFKSLISLQRHERRKHNLETFFCSVCDLKFRSAADAKSHRGTTQHKAKSARQRCKGVISRNCTSCNLEVEDIMALKEHIRMNHPNIKYSCIQCGAYFVLPQELSRHVRDKRCKLATNLSSNIMEQSSEIPDNFIINVTRTVPLSSTEKSPSKPVSCSSTSEKGNEYNNGKMMPNIDEEGKEPATSGAAVTSNEIYFTIESSSTSNDNGIYVDETLKKGDTRKCKLCSFRNESEAELIFHEIMHTVTMSMPLKKFRIKCPFCNKFYSKAVLRYHLKSHTNEPTHNCDKCTASFESSSNLKEHMKKVHVRRDQAQSLLIYCCSICGRTFKKRNLLSQHLFTHRAKIGGKVYGCDLEGCNFEGRTIAELRQHLSKHSDKKIFPCNIPNCDYSGKTALHLKRHMKFHAPPTKLFSCTLCTFQTRHSSHLTRHQRIHDSKQLYQCPHCCYRCNTLDNLKKHVVKTLKHQGRFLYECNECAMGTNIGLEFKEHCFEQHNRNNINLTNYFQTR